MSFTVNILVMQHVAILLQGSKNKDQIDGDAYGNTFKKIILQGLTAYKEGEEDGF